MLTDSLCKIAQEPTVRRPSTTTWFWGWLEFWRVRKSVWGSGTTPSEFLIQMMRVFQNTLVSTFWLTKLDWEIITLHFHISHLMFLSLSSVCETKRVGNFVCCPRVYVSFGARERRLLLDPFTRGARHTLQQSHLVKHFKPTVLVPYVSLVMTIEEWKPGSTILALFDWAG